MKESATVVATTTLAAVGRPDSEGIMSAYSLPDLRKRERAYQEVADVGDDLRVAQPRRCAQLLPLRIGAEGLPHFVAAGQVFVREHVGQAGLVRSRDGLAEEHGLPAGASEGADLAVVEHFDL